MFEQFVTWGAFTIAGRRFLFLEKGNGETLIRGAAFENYGAWMGAESFKKHYRVDGEKLRLDVAAQ